MLTSLLICALTFGMPTVPMEIQTDESNVEAIIEDTQSDNFWNRQKTTRIGYEFHLLQNNTGGSLPVRFSVGLSNTRNVWLHYKPIAGIIKFSFDHGADANYSMLNTDSQTDDYTGPSGYLGTDDYVSGELDDSNIGLGSMGLNYLSLGYALGASVSINPIAQLGINCYFHFVPSAALIFGSSALNVGFMPYCKYGAEFSYGWFGIGVEWGSGMSNTTDFMTKLMTDSETDVQNNGGKAPKQKYYSNYTKVYLSFKFTKKKKRI